MNITQLSRARLMQSASQWSVPSEYFDPLFNYLVYGYEPGSFWSAVLANDFMAAIGRSHPANDIASLKHAAWWIQDSWPPMSHGNLQVVQDWLSLPAAERRQHLEQRDLIYTEQEEIMRGLRSETSPEPHLD